MALIPEERPTGIRKTTEGRLDAWQGPYTSLAQAQATVPDFAKPGQTIQLITGGTSYDEYWWKDGITLAHLVLKNQGGSGADTPDATTATKGKVRLAGDLGGSADSPTVPALANKLDRTKLVQGANVTIAYDAGSGNVTVSSTATVDDATTVAKGKIRLAGDLGGSADAPTVPGLVNKPDRNQILGGSNVSVAQNPNGTITISSTGGTGSIADADAVTKGKLRLAGDLSGTADVPTVPGLANKIDRTKLLQGTNVTLNYDTGTGNLTINSDIADASTTVRGKVKLAGDLAGTADAPTVPALANKIDRTKIIAGENASVSFDSGSGNLTVAGVFSRTITQTAHGFSIGTILKRDASSYSRAIADSFQNSQSVGIVTQVVDANTFVMHTMSGAFITLSGLTAGAIYFLSQTTAGAYTSIMPTTGIAKIVFQAITTTQATWLNAPYSPGGASDSSIPGDDDDIALTDSEYMLDVIEIPWTDAEYLAWYQSTTGGVGGGGGQIESDIPFTGSEFSTALTTESEAFTSSEYNTNISLEEEAYTSSEYNVLGY